MIFPNALNQEPLSGVPPEMQGMVGDWRAMWLHARHNPTPEEVQETVQRLPMERRTHCVAIHGLDKYTTMPLGLGWLASARTRYHEARISEIDDYQAAHAPVSAASAVPAHAHPGSVDPMI
jgi:hypothetical protein